MKIKQTIIILVAVFSGLGFALANPRPVLAAECGGVQTGVIECETTKQVCSDGSIPSPQAVIDPDDSTKTITKNLCANGDTPATVALSESGLWQLLRTALSILTAGIGIVAVGGIVYGGLLYTTSRAKPEQRKKALITIFNVLIGLIMYALMAVLLNFIIPGGII